MSYLWDEPVEYKVYCVYKSYEKDEIFSYIYVGNFSICLKYSSEVDRLNLTLYCVLQ
jgi:hypothetical protein